MEGAKKKEIMKRLGTLSSVLIFAGIVMLCQPVSLTLFKFGFPTAFTGTVIGMVLGYIRV